MLALIEKVTMQGAEGLESSEFVKVLHEASRRLAGDTDGYGNLRFTRKEKSSTRKVVREPEARHVLASVLEGRKVTFGLEVPTGEKYAFTKNDPDVANTDLAVDPDRYQINVELKTNQPNVSKIEKDFRKLISERATGSAFYHILQNADSGTLPLLMGKYAEAYQQASRRTERGARHEKWFVHYVVVRRKREARWRFWGEILHVSGADFDESRYERIEFPNTPGHNPR